MKVDKKIAIQILYHFCRLDCEDEEFIEIKNKIKEYANKFHRIDECGVIK
jgi:hypothetical protein